MRSLNFRWLLVCVVGVYSDVGFAQESADDAPRRRDITNSIGMTFTPIPAGEFLMGGTEPAEQLVKAYPAYNRKPSFFRDEYPRHRVRITKPFYLGKYEVTVGQFAMFAKEAKYKTEAERDGTGGWGYDAELGRCCGRKLKFNWRNPGFEQTDDQPVVDVTWNDAVAFCLWLSKKEGKRYRLPTEAQWEYACRAGTTTRYHVGDDPASLVKIACVLDAGNRRTFPHVQELKFSKDNQTPFTLPVGSFPPNAFGLYDMHGNVWEWCSDWYGETITPIRPRMTRPGQTRAIGACVAAAVGTASPSGPALRSATGIRLKVAALIWVSA